MMMKLIAAVGLAAALPVSAHAQACLGAPLTHGSVAVAARGNIARDWVGAGLGAVVAPANWLRVALQADKFTRADDASAEEAALVIAMESTRLTPVCAYVGGAVFRNHLPPVNSWETAEMTGRSGSLGVGLGRWFMLGPVDLLAHGSIEGMVMKRNRTGDGAFIYQAGALVRRSSFRLGAMFRTSNPYETVLERNEGSFTRVTVQASVELGTR